MTINLECISVKHDADFYYVKLRTRENPELYGARVEVKLLIDKHSKKFDATRYEVGETYPVDIAV